MHTDLSSKRDSSSNSSSNGSSSDRDPFVALGADVDDGSWAAPRPAADRRLKIAAAVLAVSLVGIGGFTFGAKVGKDRGAANATPAFGRGGFPGVGGLGGGFGGRFGAQGGQATTGQSSTNDPLAAILAADAAATTTPQSNPQSNPQSTTESVSPASLLRGSITTIDATSMSVTKSDGSVVVVKLTPNTQIGQRSRTNLASLKPGDIVEITAQGPGAASTAQSTVEITAESILTGELVPEAPTTTPASSDNAAPTSTLPADLGGLLPG